MIQRKRQILSVAFSAIFALFCNEAQSRVAIDVLCFSSPPPNQIRFEMRTYFDTDAKWQTGFIKYEKSKRPIQIALKTEETLDTAKGRPSQTSSVWQEISDGRITGEYEIISQGANVYSMKYTNSIKKKTYYFDLDTAAEGSPERGCHWQPE